MRRRKRQTEGSLDSLLDTMTNVVGILVILLAVTQLGVGDAMKRIRSSLPPVNPEQLQALLDEYRSQKDMLAQLLERQGNLEETSTEDVQKKTRSLKEMMAEIERIRAALKKITLAKRIDTRQLQKLLQTRKAEAENLQKQLAKAQEELAKLKAMLDKTPEPTALAPKIVTLPNPRLVPKGADELTFICRKGRLYATTKEHVRKKAMDVISRLKPRSGRYSADALVKYFAKGTVKTENFTLKLAIPGYSTQIVLEPNEKMGEDVARIKNLNSRFQSAIRKARIAKTYYGFFQVWPDSYEEYLEARKIADRNKLPAGWQPRSGTLQIGLGTTLDFSDRTKPPPKPKPESPQPKRPPGVVLD